MSGSNAGRGQEILGLTGPWGSQGSSKPGRGSLAQGTGMEETPQESPSPRFLLRPASLPPSAQPRLILTRLFPLSTGARPWRLREAPRTLGTGGCSSWKTQSITSRRSRLWKGGTAKPPGSGRGCGQAVSIRHRASGHGAAGGRWVGGGVAAVWASKRQARKYRNTSCVFIKAPQEKRKHTR